MSTATGLHYRTAHKWELTHRQREVLALIAKGKTNAQIGEALGMTLDGAKFHVSEIISKLGVADREEAARWWLGYNSTSARLRRSFPALSLGTFWKVAGVAAGLVASAAVIAGVIALRAGDDHQSSTGEIVTPGEASTFSPGSFTRQAGPDIWTLDLRADGTFSMVAGSARFEGSYVVDGSQLVIDDSAFGSACDSDGPAPGRYEWVTSPRSLTLTVADDVCTDRSRFWERTWQVR